MGITRIDSDIYRSTAVGVEQSSYVAINPDKKPGSFVFGGSIAARDTLGGQVACRLALDSFSSAVMNFFESTHQDQDLNVAVLEEAFRAANVSVYQFGHSMAAGGRMAASLVGAVIHDGIVAVGRVGEGSAYLVRDSQCFPFFEKVDPKSPLQTIGTNSLVQVELSSIEILASDVLAVFSTQLSSAQELILGDYFKDCEFDGNQPATELCQFIFTELAASHYALVAKVGADTIYLKDRIEP